MIRFDGDKSDKSDDDTPPNSHFIEGTQYSTTNFQSMRIPTIVLNEFAQFIPLEKLTKYDSTINKSEEPTHHTLSPMHKDINYNFNLFTDIPKFPDAIIPQYQDLYECVKFSNLDSIIKMYASGKIKPGTEITEVSNVIRRATQYFMYVRSMEGKNYSVR